MSYVVARGESGRIVLEIDPGVKQEIYDAVTQDGMTLKDWFLARAEEYMRDRNQLKLFSSKAAETSPKYGAGTRTENTK